MQIEKKQSNQSGNILPIKAVIFDLDGTLLDTLEDLADAMNHILLEYGYPVRSLAEIRSFVGNGVRKLVERAAGYDKYPVSERNGDTKMRSDTSKEELEHLFQSMKNYYEAHCNEKTAPYAGIPSCLKQLRQAGFQIAVVSNKLDKAVKELVRLYFADWIEESAGDQPGMRTKPAPDTLFSVMRQLGVSPEECVYVGDSEVDIQTAFQAGIPCISVCWGFRDREYLIEQGASVLAETPADLSSILTNWNDFRKKEYSYLLFDLDGTLTNPEEGITKSVQYALADAGIEADRKDLLCFIGPPLWDSFRDFYDLKGEQIDRAVAKYRERYNETGIYENFAYEGMVELLQELSTRGYRLGVATSKPEVMAWRVLEKYGLAEWFEVVTGSELDGTRSRKSEVIEEALERFRQKDKDNGQQRANTAKPESDTGEMPEKESQEDAIRSQVLMIGDRKFDILGAREAGVSSLGVYYGFAEQGELEEAGADFIVSTIRELRSLLCGR